MKIADLKEQDLVEIVRLYETHCGDGRAFEDRMFYPPDFLLADIKKSIVSIAGCAECRVGSRWEGHSKIYFETEEIDGEERIVVRFSPNFDPSQRTGSRYKTALKAGEAFEQAVETYLATR